MKPYFLLLFLAVVSGCIKTELIPETLDPKLTLNQKSATLLQGDALFLSAVYTDDQGREVVTPVQWRSGEPVVASVSPSGIVTGIQPGQAWIYAEALSLLDSVLVTVVQNMNQPAKVEIAGAASGQLVVGQTLQLQASVLNGLGQPLSNQTIAWNSSNPAVASISANGLIRAESQGAVNITASAAGLSSLPFALTVVSLDGATRTGAFTGNSGYSVKGTATLELKNNVLKLHLGADFQASNGPQLGVYLAKNPSGGLNSSNSLKLGNLIGNSGAQSYTVPAGTGLQDYDYAVIYCIPFNVRFGTAQLN